MLISLETYMYIQKLQIPRGVRNSKRQLKWVHNAVLLCMTKVIVIWEFTARGDKKKMCKTGNVSKVRQNVKTKLSYNQLLCQDSCTVQHNFISGKYSIYENSKTLQARGTSPTFFLLTL